jgi:hypothetical protein
MPLFTYTTLHPTTGNSVTIDSGKPTLDKAFRDIRAYCKRNGYPLPSKHQIRDEATITHTPAPLYQSGTTIRYRMDSGLTKKIATVHGGKFGEDDTAHAYARLFTAAPEVLEALRETHVLLDACMRNAGRLTQYEFAAKIGTMISVNRKVIAKATGKNP